MKHIYYHIYVQDISTLVASIKHYILPLSHKDNYLEKRKLFKA